MKTTEADEPLAPRLRPVTPGARQRADVAEVANGDDDLDDIEFADAKLPTLTWTGRRRLGSSTLTELVVGDWQARAASIVDSVLDRLDVVAMSAIESSWWNVEVVQSRVGSAELYDVELRNVHFVRCKLGFVNLRGARLSDVAFTDCVIDDLELMRATATRVSFEGTRIGKLELSGSKLADFDLRGARLADIGTLEGLRGATITLDQLLEVAPAIAVGLGIRVV